MRLIDADALKVDHIVGSTTTNTECYRYVSKKQIDEAPTIDAVPVVRCRDCKHVMVFMINGHFVGACCTLHEDNNDVTGDDYCSRGAKRDEVTE